MGIGSSIALIAVGAILAFALTFDVAGVNITVIGYILMAAGMLGLLFTALLSGRRDDSSVVREQRPRSR
jgi:uncharacterized membrane protein